MRRLATGLTFVAMACCGVSHADTPGKFEGTSADGKHYSMDLDTAGNIAARGKGGFDTWTPQEYPECTIIMRTDDTWAPSMFCETGGHSALSGTIYVADGIRRMVCAYRCSKDIPRTFVYHLAEQD